MERPNPETYRLEKETKYFLLYLKDLEKYCNYLEEKIADLGETLKDLAENAFKPDLKK